MSKSQKNSAKNPNPSTLDTLVTKIDFIRDDVKKINLALWGKDGRGGLVKDVSDLKKERSTTLGIAKSIATPIIIAVVSSVITAFMLGKL